MSVPANALEAVRLLLGATFLGRAPGRRRHSFLYGRIGSSPHDRRMGIELNYDSRKLATAAIYIRRKGSNHLRSVSISEVTGVLTKFLSENFWHLSNETFGRRFETDFLQALKPETVDTLAIAIASSDLFVPPRALTLFPLVVVRAEAAFDAPDFFLCAPTDLTVARLPVGFSERELVPDQFPPMSDWNGIRERPTAWLGVWAPSLETAKRMRAAILGAIALLPHHGERYLFTGRKIFGGVCTLSDRWSISLGASHTPALAENIVLGAADLGWLTRLAEKISSDRKVDRKQMRALEYYYRAWGPDPVRRFPILFAALDAIFGDAGQATQAIIAAVSPVMGPEYTYERLKLLLGLRASVVHGGAPNVYESSKYEEYYETYGEDATRDLDLIVARCLQTVVFAEVMQERPHTHRDIILSQTGTDVG